MSAMSTKLNTGSLSMRTAGVSIKTLVLSVYSGDTKVCIEAVSVRMEDSTSNTRTITVCFVVIYMYLYTGRVRTEALGVYTV